MGRLLDRIEAYVKKLGVELHETRRSSATAAAHPIRAMRSAVTSATSGTWNSARTQGPDESRTLTDFHRSGTREAFAGDAQPADNILFATYKPVHMASVRKVHEARISGRRKPRRGAEPSARRSAGKGRGERNEAKSRNAWPGKVGTRAPCQLSPLIYGESDGTRTRDLRRDRPTL